jgi:hypothetical protein
MKIKRKNIIFISSSEKEISGGANIINKQSKIINSLNIGFNSKIIPIGKKKISKWKNSINKFFNIRNKYYGWKFEDIEIKKNYKYKDNTNKVIIRKNINFNKSTDFLIIPEIFAHLADKLCIKKNIPYAIYIQNGHAIDSTNDFELIKKVYRKASILISYSKHNSECIGHYFPKLKKKIFNVSCSTNFENFRKNYSRKKNIVTFMPRKLEDHSNLVIMFSKNLLPKNWKIKSMVGLNQKKIFYNLSKSKIFLSFSNLEGLGLPPIEAALTKNIVIGYTGEGGNEYWKKPIFNQIKNGDIVNFSKILIKKINNYTYSKKHETARKLLLKKFSNNNEIKNIKKLLFAINSF